MIMHEIPRENIVVSWRRFLQNCDFATHYIAPEYFDEPYLRDKRPFAVLALTDDEVSGVLTGCHENKHVRCGLSVRPQFEVSDARSNSEGTAAALLEGVLEEGRSSDLIDVYCWSPLPDQAAHRFVYQEEEGVVLLDLRESPQTLFRGFSDNKKTNIRKAIKLGVSVEISRHEDDILAYYEITRDWSQRKQIPVPEKGAFVESFITCQYRHLFVARHAGAIIAGVVVRGYPGGVLEYSANSSSPEFLKLRPNDLLHWRVIEWAYQENFKKYSLGGTHLFLRKFGGPIKRTYRYRHDNTAFRHYLARDFLRTLAISGGNRLPAPVIAQGKSILSYFRRLKETG
jgi:hypothetical protein